MEKQDITRLLKIIKVTYAYAFKDYSSADANLLINIWYNELKDYPTQVVENALKEALKVCKMPPTIADLVTIIDKQERAILPQNTALWDMLYRAIVDTAKQVSNFCYTFKEDGIRTQGEIARAKVDDIFNNLPPVCREYVSSAEQLIQLSKLDDDQLQFEKARFLSMADKMHERIKTKERLQISNQNICLLKE